MNGFGEFLRTAVRPFQVVLFSISLVVVVFEGIECPTWFLTLALAVVGEWPIERFIKRAKE